ncbi:piezo-type mechanosensitive ion channel component [Drosophila navojoa]|uniref:piezo-type mechanosensitive ion channel component n=1 Tax=Drosophila navojoa TaxID=7232 RepID=UPI0011BE4026|nr:piezo-type mechanosensitive ion channel component [Drosophila navojoa]
MPEVVLFFLLRLFLPSTLIFATLSRPISFSFIYLLMFFTSPWLLQTRSSSQHKILKKFILFYCITSAIIAISHVLVNFFNVFIHYLTPGSPLTYILLQIGFVRFSGLQAIAVFYWIVPDVLIFITAMIILVVAKLSKKNGSGPSEDDDVDDEYRGVSSLRYSDMNRILIVAYIRSVVKTSPVFTLLVLYGAAILRPSLPGSIYFMLFLIAGTYWAIYKRLYCLQNILIVVAILLFLQIIGFVLYQLPIIQKYWDAESVWTRIMGYEALLMLSHQDERGLVIKLNNKLHFDSYMCITALMWAYFILLINIIHHERSKLFFSIMRMKITSKHENHTPSINRQSGSSEAGTPSPKPSTLEQFFYLICDLTTFIYKNSYILLNIIMMIWSIIYHSWLTFVLLIWANILWMIPNQRRSMMRSSFFVVLYAEFLIISQYIYGMNIYETELPTKIYGLNLVQIGCVHPRDSGVRPCVPLSVKTCFLFIFWITSHQYFKEKAEDKVENDILQYVFGPRHSHSDHTLFEKSRAPRTIIFIFESVSNFVTRIWMWLLIILIFLCAMIDQVMTGFRVCYMSLFLLFLMVFQMSLQLWIKFLYGYWMFVIFYAMTILTIIYTYQFDYFDHYWETYLNVQPDLQNDIGLRRYRTKDLFLHLLVPTLTVIFTVIQLHYFHGRFIESLRQPKPIDDTTRSSRARFSMYRSHQQSSKLSGRKSWLSKPRLMYGRIRLKIRRWFRPCKSVAWRFLELHMIKAVILTTFTCAISEICCFNLFLVVLSLMSVGVSPFFRRAIFRIVTFWVSVLILMKMIYQIKYLNHSKYDYLCQNNTINFADWIGLRKTEQVWGSLLRYVAPYVVYMVVTTLHAVVKLRDHLLRLSMGVIVEHTVLFPGITRQDAENNFPGLIKYLCNYGYFKFGLEITLIALVSTIVHRCDLLAVTYILWLLILLCLTRLQCARIWYIFQLYFILSIFVQYLYLIHYPPNLCKDEAVKVMNSKEWSNPNFDQLLDTPIKSKLFLDFVVLMLISRQRKAFKMEIRQDNISYPGGDNKNIIHNIAKLGHVYFRNPTHDFCSFVRNYSDVLKTIIFCSFLWITLAIIFMGGVCSMDMLSLGYLIFALVFMLQGSEVYLQNIYYISCRWNFLIAFNVFNIVIKVCIIVLGNMMDIKDKQDYQSLFAVMHYDTNLPRHEKYNQTQNMDNYYYGPSSFIFNNHLVWHAIIFAFLILQYRIFGSYYFCHIVMDTQANTVLASRGAIIIENLHYKQIYDRREYEKNVLERVKVKMELIRASNRKSYKRGKTHAVTQHPEIHPREQFISKEQLASVNSIWSSQQKAQPTPTKVRDLRLHPHAVRTGDYYMFDEQNDIDDPVLYEEYDFLEKQDRRAREYLLSYRKKKEHTTPQGNKYSSDTEIELGRNPVAKLLTDLILLLTFRLNRLSRNYRFVHKVLSAEKKTLQDISTMNRLGLVNTAAMFSFLNQSLYEQLTAINSAVRESRFRLRAKSDNFMSLDHNYCVQLLISLWYAIIANTEVVCYLAVCVNQAANSSIISLPMPFLVLYWGALTLPRPTKTFWVTLITYTLAMIFFKCIMHQKIVLDPKLVQMAKTTDFELFSKHGKAIYDLLLLVVLFWHRYMLKKQGIWNMPRSETQLNAKASKTFVRERPTDILRKLREESGSEQRHDSTDSANAAELERDINDLLRPGNENKYVYRNIESEYYRNGMKDLEYKGGFISQIKEFFLALLHKARLSTDVYSLLFLCDFINFFVLLFGFPKFVYRHKYSTSVLETYIQGNKVPFSFLFMLVVQFLTIVAERAIYLRKALVVKIVFHFVTVVGIHIWMFFLVPYVTSHSFGATAPTVFYLIKCLHMLFSAYQMRCGYPKRILGNVFTKSFSMVNYVVFKVYMEIPFLYILRTMLDWLCIETTLTVMEWIKMEDIFQSVFIVRCYRQMDADFPVLRGKPKAFYVKCLIGGTIILILITLIWSPLFLFALVGTVGKPNVPRRADVSVKIGHYEPIYVSQSYTGIRQFSDHNYKKLLRNFNFDILATDHIMIYDAVDITSVKFDANSVTLWNMSPPDKKRLLNDLISGKEMDIRLKLSFNSGVMTETVLYETTYTLTKNKEKTREMLIRAISDDNSKEDIVVPDILPKFITVQKMRVFVRFIKDFDGKFYRPIILKKKKGEDKVWWEMHDYCSDKFYKNILASLPSSDCEDGIVFYIFNDKSFPSTMSFLEKTGIIGLYTTCVYVVSRLIRSLIANNHRRLMFEDLPYVDRILQLCNDIYLVRETKEYRLEEDLYAKLLFLYRSPETLIKWTRYREEFIDEMPSSGNKHESDQPMPPNPNSRDQPSQTPSHM